MASRAGDADLGLHLGVAIATSISGHLVAAVLRNCATLADAITRFSRYHDLFTDCVRIEARTEGRTVHVACVPRRGVRPRRHHVEAVLGTFVTAMRGLTEDRFALQEVRLRHPGPRLSPEHARVFGAPVLFGQAADEVVFDGRLLAMPIVLASAELLRELELLADGQLARVGKASTWAQRTAAAARDMLLAGRVPALADVATRLAAGSPRTLQARLAGERTTYREVLDGVRRKLATSLLANPALALTDIVFLLGFAEQSAFNHAFRRWAGTSPGEFRRRRAAGGARSG